MNKRIIILVLLVLPICVACVASKDPMVWLDDGVNLSGRTVFVILPVTNNTGQTIELDVTSQIRSQLIETLEEEKLIVIDAPDTALNSISVHSSLIDYEEGNTAKRWLLPGTGATICTIKSVLTDDNSGKMLGEIIKSQVIDSGGLFSIGAGDYTPKVVAKDIAKAISKLAKAK